MSLSERVAATMLHQKSDRVLAAERDLRRAERLGESGASLDGKREALRVAESQRDGAAAEWRATAR
jgi:hypothetical protein